MRIAFSLVLIILMNCGIGPVSTTTTSKQIPKELSKWIGEYKGTAVFVAPKKRPYERERDTRLIKIRSLDGKEQYARLEIYQNRDNRMQLDVHMEYPLVSFDPRSKTPGEKDVSFYLSPSQFSSGMLDTTKQGSYSESYGISLTLGVSHITGQLFVKDNTWAFKEAYYGVYQLNLKKTR